MHKRLFTIVQYLIGNKYGYKMARTKISEEKAYSIWLVINMAARWPEQKISEENDMIFYQIIYDLN